MCVSSSGKQGSARVPAQAASPVHDTTRAASTNTAAAVRPVAHYLHSTAEQQHHSPNGFAAAGAAKGLAAAGAAKGLAAAAGAGAAAKGLAAQVTRCRVGGRAAKNSKAKHDNENATPGARRGDRRGEDDVVRAVDRSAEADGEAQAQKLTDAAPGGLSSGRSGL